MLTSKSTILVIGANSKTAEALSRIFQSFGRTNIVFLTSTATTIKSGNQEYGETIVADFTCRKDIKDICLQIQPSVIVNTAAFTNVDACETERQKAWTVNVIGVENLVHVCRLIEAHLIQFSTDYVFDGNDGPYIETAMPHPIGYYGKTKLASENVCVGSQIDYTIIRTNVLYGATRTLKADFVMWVLKKLGEEKPFSVVYDQFSNPTLIDDLAYLVEKIIQTRQTGIFHSGGQDWLNRYDFARKVAEVFKLNSDLISPMLTAELQQPAHRPLKGGLISLKAETTFGIKFSGVERGLLTMRRQLQYMGHREWAS